MKSNRTNKIIETGKNIANTAIDIAKIGKEKVDEGKENLKNALNQCISNIKQKINKHDKDAKAEKTPFYNNNQPEASNLLLTPNNGGQPTFTNETNI